MTTPHKVKQASEWRKNVFALRTLYSYIIGQKAGLTHTSPELKYKTKRTTKL